jgi:GNAT superfamily N-acetyltransferase
MTPPRRARMNVTVRPAEPEDEPFLAEMLRFAAFPPGTGTPTAAVVRTDERLARYVHGWGRDGDAGVIAEHSRDQVGAAWYRHFSRDLPGHGFVSEAIPEVSIAVSPGWRGNRIGSRLLSSLVDEARRHGEVALSLSVSLRNTVAMQLYRSVGFEPLEPDAEHPTMLLVVGPASAGMRDDELEASWGQWKRMSYPEAHAPAGHLDLRGIDLGLLDAEAAAVVEDSLRDGRLSNAGRRLLAIAVAELGWAISTLPPEARDYFDRLRRICEGVLARYDRSGSGAA